MSSKYKEYKLQLISFAAVMVAFKLFSVVLIWNESRSGFTMNDLVINTIGPFENHLPIFILTYGLILSGLWNSLATKDGWVKTNLSILFFLVFRTITLTFIPLDPPPSIIPLKDFFLTNTFYCNKVLVRDLFFSGHTCAVFLLFFLVEKKWVKYVLSIGGFLLGCLLVMQHVHWTIDVIAAPFFSFLAYKCGTYTYNFVISKYPQINVVCEKTGEVVVS